MQHIHILGICGTFMGSLAQLAKAKGYRVTGSDLNVYPPMSTQLEAAGIELYEGWDTEQLSLKPDLFVVGNVISRGNPVMEAVLNQMLPYTSGPAWLAEHILRDRWVLAVSGTHGKTTTASMLAWVLEFAAMEPGYLIGGVPQNFPTSARLGKSDFFVIEADEYDSAFFDKRSKFIHYLPRTLIMNNLEFDHADIFSDLAAIQRQFHHLIRTVPSEGLLLTPCHTPAIDAVIDQGCWTPIHTFGKDGQWSYELLSADGSAFAVMLENQKVGEVQWTLTGLHNVLNALAAISAARHVGVVPAMACEALSEFGGVKRRMELIEQIENCFVYDDFAHHPTAIATTLDGLRKKVKSENIIAVIEPRSNTMRQGVHRDSLVEACAAADHVFWFEPKELQWSLADIVGQQENHYSASSIEQLISMVTKTVVSSRDEAEHLHIVIMSNGGFGGFHTKLTQALNNIG